MAAFMLHQAAEQTLRALIMCFSGNDVRTHNLTELLQHCKKYTCQIQPFLHGKTIREKILMEKLDKAYAKSRYTKNYGLEKGDLEYLISKVEQLMIQRKEFLRKFLGVLIDMMVKQAFVNCACFYITVQNCKDNIFKIVDHPISLLGIVCFITALASFFLIVAACWSLLFCEWSSSSVFCVPSLSY